jgi:hypothetical protein
MTPAIEQTMSALAEANRIRLARADLKRAIKRGEISVAEVLQTDFPEWLTKMPVGQLVEAVPGVGTYRCARVLNEVPVSPLQRLGYVTTRQRNVLAELLDCYPQAEIGAVA